MRIWDSENLVSWTTDIHQWSANEFLKSRCDSKLKSASIVNSCADLHWLLQLLSTIHKELLKDHSTHDKADSKKSFLWMNKDLSNDLWRTKATDDDSFHSEAFQLNQRSYSENELLELRERRSIVSVWRWRHSTFSDLLQQEHDFRRMQLRDLWQETADHYSLLEALMLWIEMYRYSDQDLYRSSEFKVLHDDQRIDQTTD